MPISYLIAILILTLLLFVFNMVNRYLNKIEKRLNQMRDEISEIDVLAGQLDRIDSKLDDLIIELNRTEEIMKPSTPEEKADEHKTFNDPIEFFDLNRKDKEEYK